MGHRIRPPQVFGCLEPSSWHKRWRGDRGHKALIGRVLTNDAHTRGRSNVLAAHSRRPFVPRLSPASKIERAEPSVSRLASNAIVSCYARGQCHAHNSRKGIRGAQYVTVSAPICAIVRTNWTSDFNGRRFSCRPNDRCRPSVDAFDRPTVLFALRCNLTCQPTLLLTFALLRDICIRTTFRTNLKAFRLKVPFLH